MLGQIIEQTRERVPLIHNLTSYVVANDCANITLACGASPIMAEELTEVEEIVSAAAALVMNTGILTEVRLTAMLAAGKRANYLERPVILDPVGAGVSRFRTYAVLSLIKDIRVQVIRGNNSEIRKLHEIYSQNKGEAAVESPSIGKGVDASELDIIREEELDKHIRTAKELAGYTGAIVVITGAIDIITDGTRVRLIHNGVAMLRQVTGSGCMLSSVIGAYCGANPRACLDACTAAAGAIGLCGEYAYEKIQRRQEGSASLRCYLIDGMSQLSGKELQRGIRLEER